jgi:hypothetical protein
MTSSELASLFPATSQLTMFSAWLPAVLLAVVTASAKNTAKMVMNTPHTTPKKN